METGLSLGHYNDINHGNHTSVFYDLRYHYTNPQGTAINVDLGINNSLIMDKWALFPYMFYLSYPLDQGRRTVPDANDGYSNFTHLFSSFV